MMKKWPLFLGLYFCLCLLAACTAALPAGAPGETPADTSLDAPADLPAPGEAGPPQPSLAEDEEPTYITCRIADGAEEGELLLAELPAISGNAEDSGASEEPPTPQNVYRVSLNGPTVPQIKLDRDPAMPDALEDGMVVRIGFNGNIMETFPAQLGEVYTVSAYSIGTCENPGGTCYDLCGLYLQVLDDLWKKDPGLNEDIKTAGLDLSQAPGGLSESEKAALAWRFGELHGVEVVTGTFEELEAQGYFTPTAISTPAPQQGEDYSHIWNEWKDGCLFSITPNEGHDNELYSLPIIFFNAEKWRSPLGAYCFYDCSALWPEMGTWSTYKIGSEMIS